MNFDDELRPGDIVSIRFAGVLRHYGVVTSDGRVVSNSSRHGGVVSQTVAEFADGRNVKRHRAFSDLDGHVVASRARSRLGHEYRLTDSNCVDFARWSHRRRPTSWQVGAAVIQTVGDMFKRR